MRIGLCGAHRTGKTTLAKALAEALNLRPVLSGTSAIVAEHGFDMALNNRLAHENGLKMQRAIVDALLENQTGDSFIADRTPIDAAAYMLADATASAGYPQRWEDTLLYVEAATRDTFKRFDLLVLVPPAIGFVSEPGKPPMNCAYQFHHHTLCRGLAFDHPDYLTVVAELPFEVTDLGERVSFVKAHLADAQRNRKLRMVLKSTEIF